MTLSRPATLFFIATRVRVKIQEDLFYLYDFREEIFEIFTTKYGKLQRTVLRDEA
jgi:hypothetical protein